jgi:type IX secretion system PorP/SprF family membrane protein
MVLSSLLVSANAQQKPYYTQVVMNNFILNPALSGIENYTDVKLSYRNQWTGLTGAPVTTYLSLHGPIGKKDYATTATSFDMKGNNPRGQSFLDDYTVAPAHQGIGAIIMNDKTGFFSRFSAYATYAYHKPLGVKTALAVGFQAGISSISLDRTKIVWGSLDPNDPAIGYANGDLKKLKPELGAGLWLYSKNYFVGASVLNIIPGKIKFVKNNVYGDNFDPHFFATAGYRYLLDDDFSILPSVGLLFFNPRPSMIMANAKLQYQDKAWIGVTYRQSDLLGGYAAMAGVNIAQSVNITYSYDNATTSRLKSYVGNTHEIMLGFILGNKYGDTCPRNVW